MRIFHTPLNVNLKLAKSDVKTSFIFHTLVRPRDWYTFEDTLYVIGFDDEIENAPFARVQISVPDKFVDYFVGQWAVPGQDLKFEF